MTKGYREQLAARYVEVADDRSVTVFPLLVDRIRERGHAERLLDYGGGDGTFAALCAALPLAQIVTYDPSPAMTELAQRTRAGDRVTAAGATRDLPSASFDVITSNAVWMCWTSEEECLLNLREIERLLAPGGVFLASVTHPCFRDVGFATYRTDFDRARYLEDGTSFRVRMFDGEREVELVDTHWSLGAMTRQLRASGLRVVTITEVADAHGAAGSPWMIVEAEERP